MKRWLTSPYPSPDSQSLNSTLKTAFLVGVFITLFLLIFRPFDLPKHNGVITFIIIAGYGIITSALEFFFVGIIPRYFPQLFGDKHWNLWKHILFVSAMIFCIAICNIIYTSFLYEDFALDINNIILLMSGTFALGIMPTSFYIAINLVRLDTKYKKEVDNIYRDQKTIVSQAKQIIFTSDYDEPDVLTDSVNFLFAESDSNYLTLYTNNQGKLEKHLIRSSLKKAESSIEHVESIVKTHRSYLVNLENVKDFTGNAQGFVLDFGENYPTARVSRACTKMIKTYFSKT